MTWYKLVGGRIDGVPKRNTSDAAVLLQEDGRRRDGGLEGGRLAGWLAGWLARSGGCNAFLAACTVQYRTLGEGRYGESTYTYLLGTLGT